MDRLQQVLNSLWYERNALRWLLWPLAVVFKFLVSRRRKQYLAGTKPVLHPDVPVIVVGNISIGGTGKTPVTLWLIDQLRQQGWSPGVVSRGYGGKAPVYPHLVSATDPASVTGDEPLMIHLRSGAPVVVDPDRSRAVHRLLQDKSVNLVISDDGLQHYPLARTFELVVVDSSRGFGNGQVLPMGPLREPLSRISSVDAIIVNGGESAEWSHLHQRCFAMTVAPARWVPLNSVSREIMESVINGQFGGAIHALAGIGNPQRFFDTLSNLGFQFEPHMFPDHHDYTELDLEPFESGFCLTTEKDAVKLRQFDQLKAAYLPINAQIQSDLIGVILARLKEFNQNHRHKY